MDISSRKKKILAAVIEEYIRTAEPVGSKAIAASADLGCSSATIRNELAELVAMGYLEQPHTSAGRVPTPLGYRMYVNELMEHKDLTAEETQAITQSLTGRHQRGELMTDASRLASQLTNYPAVTLTTSAGVTIRRFDLIYLDANSFIIVLLLSDDTVKNKLVHLPVSAEQSMIQKLATVFNAHFTGIHESDITPVLIRSAERAAQDNLGITAVIAAFAIEVLTGAGAAQTYLVGESQLLHQPEFRDPDKAHRLMSYLSDGSNLLDIPMEQLGGDNEVRVLIGPENVAEELRDSSVVLATYDAGENMRGLIGVVGPTRMDYSKVAAKLSFIAAGLSKLLGGGTLPPPGLDNKLIIKGDDTDEHENERPEDRRDRRGPGQEGRKKGRQEGSQKRKRTQRKERDEKRDRSRSCGGEGQVPPPARRIRQLPPPQHPRARSDLRGRPLRHAQKVPAGVRQSVPRSGADPGRRSRPQGP